MEFLCPTVVGKSDITGFIQFLTCEVFICFCVSTEIFKAIIRIIVRYNVGMCGDGANDCEVSMLIDWFNLIQFIQSKICHLILHCLQNM